MNLVSAIKTAGRGLRRVPGALAMPFVQRSPSYPGEAEDELVEVPPEVGQALGAIPDEGGIYRVRRSEVPAGTAQRQPETGGTLRPTALTRALPGALQAGIEAAATPNIVTPGGMPVPGGASVMRALQRSGAYRQEQDILGYNVRRQAEQDRLAREREASEAGERAARGEYYRAQAASQRTLAGQREKTVKEKHDELVALGFPPDQARLIAAGQSVEKPAQMMDVTPELGKKYQVPPDAQGRYRVPVASFDAIVRAQDADPKNPTEASLALAAAGGDTTAKKALDLIHAARGGPDERQKKARVSSAWTSYQNALNEAEQQFQTAKAALDRAGTRPGTKHPTTTFLSTLSWEDYNRQLQDLESGLQTKKNNAQGALEATLAEFDVPFTPQRYPHPSAQRGAGAPPPPGQLEAGLSKELAAQILPGEEVALDDGSVWQRDRKGILRRVK